MCIRLNYLTSNPNPNPGYTSTSETKLRKFGTFRDISNFFDPQVDSDAIFGIPRRCARLSSRAWVAAGEHVARPTPTKPSCEQSMSLSLDCNGISEQPSANHMYISQSSCRPAQCAHISSGGGRCSNVKRVSHRQLLGFHPTRLP